MTFAPPIVVHSRLGAVAVVLFACLMNDSLRAPEAVAQVGWEPFPETEARRPARGRNATPPPAVDDRPVLPPMDGRWSDKVRGAAGSTAEPATDQARRDGVMRETLPPLDERSRSVDRGDLQPVMAGDGTGLPLELWRGLDAQKIEALFAALEIPPRSPALASLWRRLISSEARAPTGPDGEQNFAALRIEALTRSGLLKEAGEAVARLPGGPGDALAAILTARNEIALGRRDVACEAVRAAPPTAGIPKALKTEAILISGYCAISGGNRAAAGLTADLAREHGADASAGLAALDALAVSAKPDLRAAKHISPVEYRLIELNAGADLAPVVELGTPATVAAVASDARSEPKLRIAAGEAALRLNAISSSDLVTLYRTLRGPEAADVSHAAAGGSAERRAALFNAAEAERTPLKKVRLIRSFLDDARRAGLYLPALSMMAEAADAVIPAAEIGWFAETAIEIALAAGQYDKARDWVRSVASVDRGQHASESGPLGHWLALVDITDPKRSAALGASLASVEALALRGRFNADLLHRLATVLDALDTHVPIPLWEAASRTPQPSGGHLPETGVLTELLDASKKKEFGRTVLIAMQALGPNGAEGAHMIALGDSIRALKRAGLEADARRLGLEALFASWPRSASN